MMTIDEMRSRAEAYCKYHGITLVLDWPKCQPDEGAYADNTIWIGECSDPMVFGTVFCHELGHYWDDRFGIPKLAWAKESKIASELTAWGAVPRFMFEIFGTKINDGMSEYIGRHIATYHSSEPIG